MAKKSLQGDSPVLGLPVEYRVAWAVQAIFEMMVKSGGGNSRNKGSAIGCIYPSLQQNWLTKYNSSAFLTQLPKPQFRDPRARDLDHGDLVIPPGELDKIVADSSAASWMIDTHSFPITASIHFTRCILPPPLGHPAGDGMPKLWEKYRRFHLATDATAHALPSRLEDS